MDTVLAESEPGALAVFTHKNMSDYQQRKGFFQGGPGTASFWPMTGTSVRYAGQPRLWQHPCD